MSITTNIDHLLHYFDSKTAEVTPDATRLYGDCHCFCYPQPAEDFTFLCASPRGELFHSTITMKTVDNGMIYRAAFPIRCTSEVELHGLQHFVEMVNARIAVGRLSIEDGCLYLTRGVDTRAVAEKDMLLSVLHNEMALGNALSRMTPYILGALSGENLPELAAEAAFAYIRADELSSPASDSRSMGVPVQAWEIDPSEAYA